MKIYFDSSAFAKRYIEEVGSEAVNEFCQDATELALNVLCVPEIVSALSRRVRESVISPAQYGKIKQLLLTDVRDAVLIDLTESVVTTSIQILESAPIRAADALHVASAIVWEADRFVSADQRQVAAATAAGLATRRVQRLGFLLHNHLLQCIHIPHGRLIPVFRSCQNFGERAFG